VSSPSFFMQIRAIWFKINETGAKPCTDKLIGKIKDVHGYLDT
jgi:hypothetical protein